MKVSAFTSPVRPLRMTVLTGAVAIRALVDSVLPMLLAAARGMANGPRIQDVGVQDSG